MAQKLYDSLDPYEVARAQAGLRSSRSEGQRRMTEIYGQGSAFTPSGDARSLEFAPAWWSGIGPVRGGAGTALVGLHDQVAAAIERFRQTGSGLWCCPDTRISRRAMTWGMGLPALQRLSVTVTNRPGNPQR